MWLFTKDGYFSAVKDSYCEEGELMIRARCKDDLKKMLKAIKHKAKILDIAHADYRFRVAIPATKWAEYCSNTAEGIDYPNFKNTVYKDDHTRHEAYMGCWRSLLNWQDSSRR